MLQRSITFNGNTLAVRDLAPSDIALVNEYWSRLSPSDVERMSLDPAKIPDPYLKELDRQRVAALRPDQRTAEILIWDLNHRPIGMSTLRNIRSGEYGEVHLHVIEPIHRRMGYGQRFFALSLEEFFVRFNLKLVVCEPSAANEGPNRLLQRLGLAAVRTYRTIPGPLNREHQVNRYEITSESAGDIVRRLV